MKYAIVYLIKGKAEKYHQKLVKKVGPMFGENQVVENPIPSHSTIKYSFRTGRIKEIEVIIKNFVKTHKSQKVALDGFGNFRRFVAFSKLNFSKGALKIQKDFVNEIKKSGIVELDEKDTKFKPHATIAYGNTKKSFDKIWDYLKTKEQQRFNLKLDNITIIKKPKKYWKIHKEFKLK